MNLEKYEKIIQSSNNSEYIKEIEISEKITLNDRLYYILNQNKDIIERRGFKYQIISNKSNEKEIELFVRIFLFYFLICRRQHQL